MNQYSSIEVPEMTTTEAVETLKGFTTTERIELKKALAEGQFSGAETDTLTEALGLTEPQPVKPAPVTRTQTRATRGGVPDMIVQVLQHLGAVSEQSAVQNKQVRAALAKVFGYHTNQVHSVMMKLAASGRTRFIIRGNTNYHWLAQ